MPKAKQKPHEVLLRSCELGANDGQHGSYAGPEVLFWEDVVAHFLEARVADDPSAIAGRHSRAAESQPLFPSVSAARTTNPDTGLLLGDLDLLWSMDGKLGIGEVKTSTKRFGGKDQEKLLNMAELFNPDTVMVSFSEGEDSDCSHLKDELTAKVKEGTEVRILPRSLFLADKPYGFMALARLVIERERRPLLTSNAPVSLCLASQIHYHRTLLHYHGVLPIAVIQCAQPQQPHQQLRSSLCYNFQSLPRKRGAIV